MTLRRIRFGSASMLAFVGDAGQDRLLGGREVSVSLDGRFTPALLLRPWQETLDALDLDGNIGRPGR
jgi:hypothetical protein